MNQARTTRTTLLTATLLATFIAACDSTGNPPSDQTGGLLIVANGGNFADQNGTLTRIDLLGGRSVTGPPLDGFVQGITIVGDELAVLVNTFSDGRVDLVARDDLSRRGSVTGLDSPRDAVAATGSLFVSTFALDGSGSVLRIDPWAASVTGRWDVPGSFHEGIAFQAGRVFVAAFGFLGDGTTIAVVDPAVPTASHAFEVPCDGPRDLVPRGERELIVVCQGRTVYSPDFSTVLESTPGRIVVVDAGTDSVLASYPLAEQVSGANGTPSSLVADDRGALVTLDTDHDRLLLVDLSDGSAVGMPVAANGSWAGLSGLALDPESGHLFVGRLARGAGGFPDYAASGSVLEMDMSGLPVASYPVGVSPTAVLLLH